jgi:hypothetical protein
MPQEVQSQEAVEPTMDDLKAQLARMERKLDALSQGILNLTVGVKAIYDAIYAPQNKSAPTIIVPGRGN